MKETYYFRPAYDGHVHGDFVKTPSIGTEFIGPMGLLSRLELKLGLTRRETPDYEREKLYQQAIGQAPLNLLLDSFEGDAANTTKKLLRWRDALVMAGWNGEGNSDLLKELAAIEVVFKNLNTAKLLGIADRWIEVKNNVSSWATKIDIIACCKDNQIHPTIKGILEGLGAEFNPMSPADGNKIIAYEFTDAYDAYQTAAVKLNPYKDIIVVQNSKALNDALQKVGQAPIEATLEDANSSVLQLFKLTLLMFAEPNNLRNIVSYLMTRPCPITHGNKLGEYLLSKCGWGDAQEWMAFIGNLGKDKNGKPILKKDGTSLYSNDEINAMKDEFQKFKDLLDGIQATTNGATIKKEVEKLYDKTKKYNNDPIVRAQLKNVREFCKHIFLHLDEKLGYKSKEIKQLVDRIFSEGTYKMASATTKSFFTYPSLECIHDTKTDGHVVWVDCYGELLPDYDYDFLSVTDIAYLTANAIIIWKNTDQVAAKVALLSAAAKHAGKEVILFVPKNAQGERVKQSPLLTDLGIELQYISGSWLDLKKSKEDVVEFPSKPKTLYYDIPEGITIPQREKESYSSLEMLIQYPFDYVLKYACGLYAPEIDQLEGISRICGSVAHKTLENLYKLHKGNLDNMEAAFKANLSDLVNTAAQQCGMVLLLSENRFVLEKLKQDLQNAFTNLITILRANNLSIAGMEEIYSEKPSSIVQGNELEARIDLVLKDQNGKVLIFDLKYGTPKYYREKLEKDEALQLDIYKYCVENATPGNKAKVRMVGYYNLKEGKLFTLDKSLTTDANVVTVDVGANATITKTLSIPQLVQNSYEYRFGEFNGEEHHIEEAEGEYTSNLGYPDKTKRYPLKTKNAKKDINNFSDYKLFKGGSK